MTEARIRDLLVALETARDADARRAGDLPELAAICEGVRDSMGEMMISVQAKALGLDKPLAGLRLILDEACSRMQRYALESAAACEAKTRILGPPRGSPADEGALEDTRPMGLDEIAAMQDED